MEEEGMGAATGEATGFDAEAAKKKAAVCLMALPHDVLAHVMAHLATADRCQLDRTCRALAALPLAVYWSLALHDWGMAFWARACARNPRDARRLGSMRAELVRIERFQRMLEEKGMPRWTEDDFYTSWVAVAARRTL